MRTKFFDNLARLKKAYAHFMDPVCEKFCLTRNEVDLLLFLSENPDLTRASDFVNFRGITKSHVSLSIAHLESMGLLQRTADPNDRRSVRLDLPPAAQPAVTEIQKGMQAFEAALFVDVAPEELAAFEALTDKITVNITRLGY